MAKNFLFLLLSLSLMACGWFLAKNARPKTQASALIIPFEFDQTCNTGSYLNLGSSWAWSDQFQCHQESNENSLPNIIGSGDHNFLAIQKGESLGGILKPHGISAAEVASLSKALHPYVRANEIAEGDLYEFKTKGGLEGVATLEYFILRKIDQNSIPFLYTANAKSSKNSTPEFVVSVESPPIKTEDNVVVLKVRKTLFQTFINIPFGNELMQRLMSVLTWRLQMPKEVLDGDDIEILVEHKYADGQFVGYGKIKTIAYKQSNRQIFAHYFSSKDGSIEGYFDELGRSIEKEFLVSPVHEPTATSSQKWRLHPVRKIRIRHNGTDYRGSIGTEFFSLAAGEVVEKRFDVNVGHMIRIKHNHGVYTEYFHANALDNKLKEGSKVKRGQRLGEIGRTGKLCTGPHLHVGMYTYNSGRKKFISVDTLKNKLTSLPNLSARFMPQFHTHSAAVATLINRKKEELAQNSNKQILATQ